MAKRFLDAYSADKRLDKYSGDIAVNSPPYEVFVGELVDWQGNTKRTIIAAETMEGASYEMQHLYENKAFMSLDGLLRPVSMDGDGGLPPYVRKSGDSDEAIQQDDLNPFTNPAGMSRSTVATSRSDTTTLGHDIDLVGRSGTLDEAPSGGLIMPIAGFKNAGYADYTDDYRFMALRGPLVMQGWGYDTDGYPVPNKNDVEADTAQGIFKNTGLDTTKFLNGHLKKPHTWPVAPVDLRLDRARGVWVAPASGAAPTPSQQGDTRIIAITSNYNSACCSYKGVYREIDWQNAEDICTFSGLNDPFVDVWLHKFCDTLGPNQETDCWCVIGRREDEEIFCDTTGYPLYDFLTLAIDCQSTTPCDCCCPASGDGEQVRVLLTFDTDACSIRKDVLCTWEQNVDIPSCAGGSFTDQGFVGNFTVGCQYPTRMITVNANIPNGLPAPFGPVGGGEVLALRTDYSTWTNDGVYFNDGGDWIPYPYDWEFVSVDGNCVYLFENGVPEHQPLTLYYKCFFWCFVTGGNVSTQVKLFHMPDDEVYPTSSGYIGDEGEFGNETPCMLNTQRGTINPDFGKGTCVGAIPFSDSSGYSGTYNLNIWGIHYFGMCGCHPSGWADIDDFYATPYPTYCTDNITGNHGCGSAVINVFSYW